MVQNKIIRQRRGKLLGACIIIFLGLNYGVKEIGETAGDQYFQDYINQDSSEIRWSSENLVHPAASSLTFSGLCTTQILCNIMSFIGNYPDTEKAQNAQTVSNVITFINTKNSISPQFSPTITLLKFTNNEGDRRGYATHTTILFNTDLVNDQKEFHQLSSHELGHIFDLWFLQGNASIKDTIYTEFKKTTFATNDPSLYYYKISRQNETTRTTQAKKKDFCSGYGMTDPFEDFAECFNLYLNHNALFKIIAKKNDILASKYNFLATMFRGSSISGDTKNLLLVKNSPNRRPRDTTKLE